MTTPTLKTFDDVVRWLHLDIVVDKSAPGFLVGLSGTDSIVAFLAAYKALERAGKPERLMGVHFAPSDDFQADYMESALHMWFAKEIIPWLREQAPKAQIIVDTSIDWRRDGLRWGMLMDMSVTYDQGVRRMMRAPEDQYWLVGTRNRTENALSNYSNASTIVSVQPIIGIWKSEILEICRDLKVPEVAIESACDVDCICGRMRLPASHPEELDMLIQIRLGDLPGSSARNMDQNLRTQLDRFIDSQLTKNGFKHEIPYRPI